MSLSYYATMPLCSYAAHTDREGGQGDGHRCGVQTKTGKRRTVTKREPNIAVLMGQQARANLEKLVAGVEPQSGIDSCGKTPLHTHEAQVQETKG